MSASHSSAHTAHDLLAYEPFVRSIARSLLADEDRVGDVVQETWLRALTRLPKNAVSVKSWLGRVTRNLALDEHRRATHRKSREEAAASEEAIREDEASLELHAKLVEAVLRLEEPYKSVVILRYYRGMSPTKIGAELSRNAATVRSQLHRAHEILKERLDGEFGGHRAAWLALCVPLARGKAAFPIAATAAAMGAVVLSAGAAFAWIGSQDAPLESQPGTSVLGASMALDTEAPKASAPALASAPQDDRKPLANTRTALVTFEGTPRAGVEVYCLQTDDIDEEIARANPGLMADPDRLFPLFGTRHESDAEGRVTLPPIRSEFALLGIDGDLFDLLTIQETRGGSLEIALETVPTLRVKTVNALGLPVTGVPIVLRATIDESDIGGGFSSMDLYTTETRGDAGFATLRNYGAYYPESRERSWSVRLGVPGLDSQIRAVAMDQSIDDVVTFLIGATGTVEMRAVDADGEVLQVQGTARLRSRGLERAALEQPLVDGRAHFSIVGIERELEAELEIPELGATWRLSAQGPSEQGAHAVIELRSSGVPRLVGRVQSPDGTPCADLELQANFLNATPQLVHFSSVRTDARGAFQIELDRRVSRAGISLLLAGFRDRQMVSQSELVGPLEPGSSTIDIGTVTLAESSGVIDGRVVGPNGEPLGGIHLSADQLPGFHTSNMMSRPNGNFYLPGVFPEQVTIRLARADDWVLAQPVVVERGTRGVVLQLSPAATVSGTILVDENASELPIEIDAYRVLEDGSEVLVSSAARDARSAQYEVRGLASGEHRVIFRLGDLVLEEVADVQVSPATASNDPRINVVDLRDKLVAHAFRVTDKAGVGIAEARVKGIVDAKVHGIATSSADGMVTLWTTPDPDIRVHVAANDYRDVVLDSSTLPDTLELEPAIEVRITGDRPLEPKRGDKAYFLTLRFLPQSPDEMGLERVVSVPRALLRGEATTLRFPAPGRYQLHYTLHYAMHYDHGGSAWGEWNVPTPVEGNSVIQVQDDTTLQELTLPMPRALPD